MSTTKQIIGTVSHGTMREGDLIPAFLDALQELDEPRALELRKEWADCQSTEEECEFLNETLFDTLNEYAPPYCYFGAHPGDGSDYGFWPVEDLEQSVKDDGELVVSDLCGVDDATAGYVLHVSDHGNATLYLAQDGKLTEVWGVV